MIFVGRITPSKGVLEAVLLAKKTNENLDIIGKVNDSDAEYWNSIQPHIDNEQIRYLGPKSQEQVATLFSEAKAFLFPSQVAEAFGQVTIEAQASGTPVIISNIGASTELVKHGVTGFVCESELEYVSAIKNISSIKSQDCRAFAEEFDITKMVTSYNELYTSVITKNQS